MEDKTFLTPDAPAASAPPSSEDKRTTLMKELAEAEAKLEQWSTRVDNAAIGSPEETKAKEEEEFYLKRVTALEGQIALFQTSSSSVSEVSKERIPSLYKPCEKLPNPSALRSIVEKDLATTLPVRPTLMQDLYDKVKQSHELGPFTGRVDFLESSITEEVRELEGIIWNVRNFDPLGQTTGGSEDQCHPISHAFIEMVLRAILPYFRVQVMFRRDHSEEKGTMSTTKFGKKRPAAAEKPSLRKNFVQAFEGAGRKKRASVTKQQKEDTVGQLRPDWSMHMRNLIFFRGEEKKAGVPIQEAENDLVVKGRWIPAVLGRLPYVLAYAMAGPKIRLYALHPEDNSVNVMLTAICRELDLSKAWDVLQLIKYVINLIPIIVRAYMEIEPDVPPVGEVWQRASDQFSKITVQPEYIEKVLYDLDGGRIQWEGPGGLKELYQAIEQGEIKGTVRLRNKVDDVRVDEVKTNRGPTTKNITLELVPLGYRVVPVKEELRDFLKDILGALASLHAHGWVHRDVKRKNVVKTPDGQWILIDLEYAAKLHNGKADWPFFDRPEYPMPIRKGSEKWKPCHDVQQVAIMIKGICDDPKTPMLVKALMHSKTASEAIQAIHVILTPDQG